MEWWEVMPEAARVTLSETGLAHIPFITHEHIDEGLINAFVERW